MKSERIEKCGTNQNRASLRFAADPPLGKLAKLLRMLGFDVLYSNRSILSPGDGSERRIRLTRSRKTVERGSNAMTLFISNNDPKEQLKEVVRALSVDPGQTRPFTRCIECNVVLTMTEKKDIREQVPEYVWHTRSGFCKCSGCGRIYWSGSHTNHMARFLREVFELA